MQDQAYSDCEIHGGGTGHDEYIVCNKFQQYVNAQSMEEERLIKSRTLLKEGREDHNHLMPERRILYDAICLVTCRMRIIDASGGALSERRNSKVYIFIFSYIVCVLCTVV